WPELERAVRSVFVVAAPVDAEEMLEVPAAEDEDPIEAVGAKRARPPLGEGVRVRRLHRWPDHLDALAAEDPIKGVAELRVVDEEPGRLHVADLHKQGARLLGNQTPVRVRAAGEVFDPAGGERDEEEDVDAPEEDRLRREEVAGERASCLRAQERAPSGA